MPRLAAVPRTVRSEPVASDRDRASPEAAAVPGLVFQLTSRLGGSFRRFGYVPARAADRQGSLLAAGDVRALEHMDSVGGARRRAVHDGGLPAGRGAAGRLAAIGLVRTAELGEELGGSGSQEPPQRVLEDAAVAHVLDLARRVDAQARAEVDRGR